MAEKSSLSEIRFSRELGLLQDILLGLRVILALLIFILLGICPQTWRPEARRQIWRGLIGFLFLLLVIAIPLAVIMGGIVRDTAAQQAIQEVLKAQVSSRGGELVKFEYREERAVPGGSHFGYHQS